MNVFAFADMVGQILQQNSRFLPWRYRYRTIPPVPDLERKWPWKGFSVAACQNSKTGVRSFIGHFIAFLGFLAGCYGNWGWMGHGYSRFGRGGLPIRPYPSQSGP